MADPAYFLPKVEPGRIIGGVLRRAWIVALLVAIGIAGALCYIKQASKIYRATGSVYVGTQAPQVLNIQAVAAEESRDLEQMRSVEQGLRASTLLMRLIQENGLANDPEFAPPGTGPEGLVKILSSRVMVELRRGTRLIDISVDDTKPERAKRLVEALVAEYETWTAERQRAITQQASEGLAQEETKLRERMESSALKLQTFRETHRVPGLEVPEGGVAPNDTLAALNTQLTQAKSERLRLESEYEAFKKFDPTSPDALAGIGGSEQTTEVVSQVRAIQQKEAEFAAIKERYLELHPTYKAIASELALLRENLIGSTKTAGEAIEKKYRVASENQAKLESAVTVAMGQAVEVEGLREKFRALTRESNADRTLHDAVATRLRETSLSASVPASVLRWEDAPMVPEKAHRPRKLVALALGTGGGFFMGLCLMIGLELADGKIRDAAAAARAIGVPLLARIPNVGSANPATAAPEAFRQLRAVLAPDMGGKPIRTVLFASARAGEGRSFCALNYATSLAIQGYRTLLLDADLRTAGLSAAHLEDGVRAGLGDFLAGEVSPAEACFPTELPNLYLLSSGPARDDSGELLAGSRFASLLEDSYRWFDRVVIDTPALLQSSDALSIARYADRCCLVVSDKGNDKRGLQRASEMARGAGANLVGFVWNESPAGRRADEFRRNVVSRSHPALAEPAGNLSRNSVAIPTGPRS